GFRCSCVMPVAIDDHRCTPVLGLVLTRATSITGLYWHLRRPSILSLCSSPFVPSFPLIKSTHPHKENSAMKRYLVIVIGIILVAGLIATEATAQTAQADAHIAAAKAATSPKAPNAKPWQVFESVFKQQCTPPRPGARPEAEPIGSNVPLEPGEQRKLTPTPHDQWYIPPTKVFDNLYYIGTKTESTWALTTSAGIILL